MGWKIKILRILYVFIEKLLTFAAKIKKNKLYE